MALLWGYEANFMIQIGAVKVDCFRGICLPLNQLLGKLDRAPFQPMR